MSLTLEELRGKALTHEGADAADVLPFLDSDDRNVRVAALRVLAWSDGEAAILGVLRGFDDEKRRVREVAVKSTSRFVDDARVVARLQQAVENDESTASIALMVLGGVYDSPYGLSATEPIVGALASLASHEKSRRNVLVSLLRARELTDDVKSLLNTFVVDGTKEEAVAATRRLCGFRIMRPEQMTDAERASAVRAFGQVWFWVRTAE